MSENNNPTKKQQNQPNANNESSTQANISHTEAGFHITHKKIYSEDIRIIDHVMVKA